MACRDTTSTESGAKRILVADDELHVTRLLQVNLERKGYQVKVASDGAEAVELLEQEPFDVAVLDLLMPRMDGYEVIEWIRTHERTKGMKVVLMTADAVWWGQRTDLAFQADSYVSKPFNPSEVLS